MTTATSDARRVRFAFALVLVLAAVLRFGFVTLVTRALSPTDFAKLHGDTTMYVHLGEQFYQRTAPADEPMYIRNRAVVRTPGYPIFYASLRTFGLDLSSDLRGIVWPQALLSTAFVGVVFLAAYAIFGHLAAAIVAGGTLALMPTAIASNGIALADSLYAALFGSAVLGFVVAACRATTHRVLVSSMSGLALAAAVAVKPAGMYWPLLALPALMVLRGFTRSTFRDAALLFVPTALVVLYGMSMNYRREGMATYSIVATRNLRYDVAARVELTEQLGRPPFPKEYDREADRLARRDRLFLNSAEGSPKALQEQISAEVRAIFTAHPVTTAGVLWRNVTDGVSTRWLRSDRQLPADDGLLTAIKWLIDKSDSRATNIAWFTMLGLAVPLCWFSRDRRPLAPLIVCVVAWLYVAAGVATVRNEGARLMTGADGVAAMLVAGTVCYLGDRLKRPTSPRP